jgi:ubiquinone/menaquinone biosynthesis C-methylase UbiE
LFNSIKKHLHQISTASPVEKTPGEAYDLWSATYDQQPGNLMLDLDKKLFSKLIEKVNLKGKIIADIGCGTGRHWPDILIHKPLQLRGYDVSTGMLKKLKEKFPEAIAVKTYDDLLTDLPDRSCDVLISTLTMAHLTDAENALKAWCRVLQPNSELIITDFHPDTLANGGKRTFRHEGRSIAVQNFVYSTSSIKDFLKRYGFSVISEEQRYIDQSVKHYYQEQQALSVYEQFEGMPIIYGLHLKRTNGI